MTQHLSPHPADPDRAAVRAGRAAPSAGRLVALVVVLAGLFGMHGLAGHGSHGADTSMGMGMDDSMVTMSAVSTMTTVAITVATPGVAVEGRDGAAMASAVVSRAVTSTAGAAHDLTNVVSGVLSGGSMSMLCLAVLTAGVFLLLLVLRRPRVALAWMPAPAPVAPLGLGRDRDPPSLTLLSIRRC